MIRKINKEDKENWKKLYKGYADFYKTKINDKILDTVWVWLMDKNHETKGIDYEINGNFLGYIKFKRAVSKSKKSLNFDKETISVVQNDSTGAIIVKGVLTIVGLPDEFF